MGSGTTAGEIKYLCAKKPSLTEAKKQTLLELCLQEKTRNMKISGWNRTLAWFWSHLELDENGGVRSDKELHSLFTEAPRPKFHVYIGPVESFGCEAWLKRAARF